jgi:hypothetical protein
MDWRQLGELIAAGEAVFSELKNVWIWNKTNGGMGTFYRLQHELVLAFKVGGGPHTNTFGLGDGGRFRTNVWDYAGVNTMKKGRMDELGMHPTVKPVSLVADAILDVTKRGALVLDPFGGSGTTLIAAEKTGRVARLIEFDPLYSDVIIRRFEASRSIFRTGQLGCPMPAPIIGQTTRPLHGTMHPIGPPWRAGWKTLRQSWGDAS